MTQVGRWQTAKGLVGLVAAQLALSSCFDSRWFDARQAQRTALKNATPAELRATPQTTEIGPAGAPAIKGLRVLKVRARATTRYAAEVTDWPKQTAALVEEANLVLGPTLKLRLELAGTAIWARSGSDDDLSALDEELVGADPGQDVEWVIGLVGSVPRYELSFHQLGLTRAMSKHFVMRAMNDAREYEAIERELSGIDEQERRKLYRARKRHKTTTVFLHELAHTLSALHEPDAKTIMHSSYDPKAEGYSTATAELMRLTLEHRLSPAAQTEQAFAQALLDQLDRTASSWVASERDATVKRLKAMAAPPAQPAGPPAASKREAAVTEDQVASLSAADRAIFGQAAEDQRAGKVREAWAKAKPLFAAYPGALAVQDLRCQLAMRLGMDWSAAQAECAPLMKLTLEGAGGTKR
jgi:hypothetical protein